MRESRFNDFNDFLQRINLTNHTADSAIFILDVNDISDSVLEEFSLYRNEFYEINLFNGLKNFRFAIDGVFYDPDGKPAVYFVAPNQLQSFEIVGNDEDAEGYLIYIQKDIYRQIEKENKPVHFFKREYESYYEVSEQDYETLSFWADLMKKESISPTALTPIVLKNLLSILLLKSKAVTKENKSPLYGRPQEILTAFHTVINSSTRIPKVSECASHLALTPKQLNAVTKEMVGKTATEVIRENFSNRAKALLVESSLSIKEIAHQLGFEEVSNFSRFFKSLNNTSAIVFREQNGAN